MSEIHIVSGGATPRPLNVLGESVTVFAQDDTSKPFEMHLQEGRRGGGPPPHHHPWDEAFYVLAGEVRVEVDGSAEVLGAGSFVHIPAHTTHAYTNVSETAKLLAVVSDCKGGQTFAEYDQQVKHLPDDLPKVVEIGSRFGVTFVEQNA